MDARNRLSITPRVINLRRLRGKLYYSFKEKIVFGTVPPLNLKERVKQ
jgi:hypothetical protein